MQLFACLFTLLLLSAGCGPHSFDRADDRPDNTANNRSDNGEQKSEPEIDWGREVNLDEMIALAKEGRIEEIQWHVLPNILRARAVNGELYHLINENRGVDLRTKLLEAGVPIGKEGLQFHHVF